jgi:hypothetical protein
MRRRSPSIRKQGRSDKEDEHLINTTPKTVKVRDIVPLSNTVEWLAREGTQLANRCGGTNRWLAERNVPVYRYRKRTVKCIPIMRIQKASVADPGSGAF